MLLVRETFTNEDKGYRFGESEWYEAYTDDRGKLFRSMQREYGRCVSSVYVEPNAKPVGWYFERREQYEDAAETYTRGVWVELREVVNGIEDAELLDTLIEVA